jgi:mono/diheme cytochrome c family protein
MCYISGFFRKGNKKQEKQGTMRPLAKGLWMGAVAAVLLLAVGRVRSEDEKIPKDILTKKNPLASSEAVLANAKKAYSDNCLQCHGESGKGDGPMSGMLKEKPADLSESKFVGGLTDGEIFWSMTKGREKIMPAFEAKLTENERWGLVVFVRSLSNTQPNNTPRSGRK